MQHIEVQPDPKTVIDTLIDRIIEQGPSVRDPLGCAYRGDNGKACPVGQLISDDNYDPRLEGQTAYVPDVQAAILDTQHWSDKDMDRLLPILSRLQEAHDQAAEYSDGEGFNESLEASRQVLKSRFC